MFTVINLIDTRVSANSVKVIDNETQAVLYQASSVLGLDLDMNKLDILVSKCISEQYIENLEYGDIIIIIDGLNYEYINSSLIKLIK